MEKETLDKIIELLKSHDTEHHDLAKTIFVESKPTSADYIYLDSIHDIFAGTVPEEYIDRLKTHLNRKLYAPIHIQPIGFLVKDPTKLLKIKPLKRKHGKKTE